MTAKPARVVEPRNNKSISGQHFAWFAYAKKEKWRELSYFKFQYFSEPLLVQFEQKKCQHGDMGCICQHGGCQHNQNFKIRHQNKKKVTFKNFIQLDIQLTFHVDWSGDWIWLGLPRPNLIWKLILKQPRRISVRTLRAVFGY